MRGTVGAEEEEEERVRETRNKYGTEAERRCGVIRARTGEGSRQGKGKARERRASRWREEAAEQEGATE